MDACEEMDCGLIKHTSRPPMMNFQNLCSLITLSFRFFFVHRIRLKIIQFFRVLCIFLSEHRRSTSGVHKWSYKLDLTSRLQRIESFCLRVLFSVTSLFDMRSTSPFKSKNGKEENMSRCLSDQFCICAAYEIIKFFLFSRIIDRFLGLFFQFYTAFLYFSYLFAYFAFNYLKYKRI